jgi:hypothetical protein
MLQTRNFYPKISQTNSADVFRIWTLRQHRPRRLIKLRNSVRSFIKCRRMLNQIHSLGNQNTEDETVGVCSRLRLKCDGTRAETRFLLSAKRTSPFKSVGASAQSTADSRGVRISGSNAGYTTFRGSVKSTGYPLHSPVSRSLPLPCVTVCHQVSNALYTWEIFITILWWWTITEDTTSQDLDTDGIMHAIKINLKS